MDPSYQQSRQKAYIWLSVFALLGFVLIGLYPDSFQQDGDYHYLFARWSWHHPYLWVGVWARPLFTLLYSFPALLGFEAARAFSVLIGVATAWQTWKLARDLQLDRPWLVIVLLFLQPSFFILFPDLLTEPLYALVFAIAVRLHLRGRIKTAAILASLLILARPEGFFHGILWGIWILFDKRAALQFWRRFPVALLLATGGLLWWLSAYLITGDPLFILHNWPREWQAGKYGAAQFWVYFLRLPEMVGLLLLVPFGYGLLRLLRQREFGTLTWSFLVLFGLHATFRAFGIFGDAGYPRYMVCVSPAIAIITLAGWNWLEQKFSYRSARLRLATARTVLVISAVLCGLYLDGLMWIRDAWAVRDAYHWFQQNPRPISQFVWSHAYMNVLFDIDFAKRPELSADRAQNLQLLQTLPAGTLIFWDGKIGPTYYGITDQDIENVGYRRLFSRSYELTGWIYGDLPYPYIGTRAQSMHLLYRE